MFRSFLILVGLLFTVSACDFTPDQSTTVVTRSDLRYSAIGDSAFLNQGAGGLEIGHLYLWDLNPPEGVKPIEYVATVSLPTTNVSNPFNTNSVSLSGVRVAIRTGIVNGTGTASFQANYDAKNVSVRRVSVENAQRALNQVYGIELTNLRVNGAAEHETPWYARQAIEDGSQLFVLVSGIHSVDSVSISYGSGTPDGEVASLTIESEGKEIFNAALSRSISWKCDNAGLPSKADCMAEFLVFSPRFNRENNNSIFFSRTTDFSQEGLALALANTFLR